uniref:Selenoprotein S n=1 Tax=Oryzias melastigma TaxID=30732 RepID=A0A3B3BQN7_ORYME
MEANEGIAFGTGSSGCERVILLTVGEVLAQFGWALLLLCSALYLLVQFLKKRRREGGSEEAEALEAARRRMQEELDCRAALYKEKMRQVRREEQKRRQRIETWESIRSGRSYRETTSSQLVTDLCLFSDYSPLSGQAGGSCSWRPGRRGPSSGG